MSSISLAEKHIANLKIVLNREDFLKQFPKGGIVAEVGVASGDFSQQILEITKPDQLYLIDAWATTRFGDGELNTVEQKFQSQIDAGQVIIQRGFSNEQLQTFPDQHFDWIYIDTSHDYETTKVELEISRHKVKPGGIISGHDYTINNVRMTLKYGVIEAVNEFCLEHDWEMILLTHEPRRYLSFALRQL